MLQPCLRDAFNVAPTDTGMRVIFGTSMAMGIMFLALYMWDGNICSPLFRGGIAALVIVPVAYSAAMNSTR
jgi:hypothetical protein